jgi:hypothetical protein
MPSNVDISLTQKWKRETHRDREIEIERDTERKREWHRERMDGSRLRDRASL